jgi:N-acetylglucosaminyl-diphospho-decaprenol L-rhamnosyltransferase
MSRVSVVVLSYARPDLLNAALASVRRQTRQPDEVIVVDNRSPRSGEVAAVVAGHPGVRLVANPTNGGFTGGMNLGLRLASGDFVCLTEDDLTLEPTALRALTDHAATNPNTLAGGVMLNTATDTVRCAGGHVRLGPTFAMTIVGENEPWANQYPAPFPVTYLPGAFLFAAADVWRRLGGFRDRYYLYMEDVDLCVRAARAGVRLEVVPAAVVRHADPTDRPAPGWLRRLKRQNLLRLDLLNTPAAVLPAFLAGQIGWAVQHTLLGRADGFDFWPALARVTAELPGLARDWVRANHTTHRPPRPT